MFTLLTPPLGRFCQILGAAGDTSGLCEDFSRASLAFGNPCRKGLGLWDYTLISSCSLRFFCLSGLIMLLITDLHLKLFSFFEFLQLSAKTS